MPKRSKISRSSQLAPGQTGTRESTTGSLEERRTCKHKRRLRGIRTPVRSVEFKARLERIAVEARGVAQQIKLEFFVPATALGNVARSFDS